MKSIRYTLLSAVAMLMLQSATTHASLTNVFFSSYATIESSANSYVDVDEITLGDLRVKSRTDVSANAARKSYIAFNLAGKSPNTNLNATLSLRRTSSSGDQHLQLWVLKQSFPTMGTNLVWGNNPILIPSGAIAAQANNTANNEMLTNGAFTAIAIGDQVVKGGNATDDFTVTAPWAQYIFDGKIVFVVAGIPDTNSPSGSAGYRISFNDTNPPPTLKFTDTLGNQPPSISSTTNLTIYSHLTSAPISFTVSDDSTVASNINLKAVSDDTTVVHGFTYTGQGISGDRTVTFVAGAAGAAIVTVNADDGSATNFIQFTVTVLPNPTITAPPGTNTFGVNPVTSSFTVGDAIYPVSTITNGATSSNPSLIADSAIIFGGGTSSNRTVTVTPQAGREGVAVINLVAGNTNGTTPASYPVMVLTNANIYFAEHFDYVDGNLGAESAVLWTNRVVGSVRLKTAGGRAKIRPSTSGESLVAPLVGGPFTDGVIYFGFNVSWTNLAAAASTNNGYFLSLYDPVNLLQVARVYTRTNDSNPSIFDLGIANTATPVAAITNLALNTNYRVVVGFDIQGGTFSPAFITSSRMWVNQTSTNGSYAQAVDSSSYAAITHVQLRQNTGTGDAFVDDLKVGASFAAVLPAIPTVSSPTFTPVAGTYTAAQVVTISTATTGASIRYTVDGATTPTSTVGTLYTSPVTISNTTTLKAVAYAGGMTDSPVASAVYTIQTAPPTPPLITSINVVANSVQIDFTGGAADVPANFLLLNVGTLPGAFTTNGSASISQLGVGSFRATVTPLPGSKQFYRIQR